MDKIILDASANGRLDVVQKLLESGQLHGKSFLSEVVKLRHPPYADTPLSKAAENGHNDIVKELIGFYDGATNFECGSPLHAACFSGHADCVSTIITRLPHLLNEEDAVGLLPIHIAAKTGHLEVVNMLIKAGADVNKRADEVGCLLHREYGSYTALYKASAKGHTDIVKALLNSNADPLMTVKRDDDSLDLLYVMDTLCPLSVAANSGHIDVLKILCKVVPLDQQYGSRAVAVAAINEQTQCLKYLLEMGAPTFSSWDRRMHLRIWPRILKSESKTDMQRKIDVVKILLDYGMSLNHIATMGSRKLAYCLAYMTEPLLIFFLNGGFLEIRYLNVNTFLACMTVCGSKKYYKRDIMKHDLKLIVEIFHIEKLFQKLDIVVNYFSVISTDITKNVFGRDIVNVSSLLRLSKWTIRCTLCEKHNFITKELVAKLNVPASLQRYLLFQNRKC